MSHSHRPHVARRYQSSAILGTAKLNLDATGGKMAFLMEEGWQTDPSYFSGGAVGAVNLGQGFFGTAVPELGQVIWSSH